MTNNDSKKFNDDQMGHFLETFYRTEMPQELHSLPSTWPQITRSSKTKSDLTVVDVPRDRTDQPSRTASRGIAVAAATLTACLMLIVTNHFSHTDLPQGTIISDQSPVTEDTMPVSAARNGSAAVDDVNTTLQEIDGVDLEPGKTKSDSSVRPPESNDSQ